ncbi:MAG: OsmC family protein [Flavobacterium sp.]|nr:OsmC family protein [Pedobacter sp.]
MTRQHQYHLTLKWTGNTGTGTSGYKDYQRSHSVFIENKAELVCSADPAFSGDSTKYNPEELFISSLSSCHMLWFLHLCAEAGVVVTHYVDRATGTLNLTLNGGGRFTEIILNPVVTVTENSMINKTSQLHTEANKLCFIANSVNFPIHHNPVAKILNV